jgi:hypothetical protein
MTFPCFKQVHDPDDSKTYAFQIALNDADSIASGSIDIVDPTSTTIVIGSDLSLTDIRPGTVDDAGAVFFRPQSGGELPIYWLRCTAVTTLGDTYVQTLGLKVGQQ